VIQEPVMFLSSCKNGVRFSLICPSDWVNFNNRLTEWDLSHQTRSLRFYLRIEGEHSSETLCYFKPRQWIIFGIKGNPNSLMHSLLNVLVQITQYGHKMGLQKNKTKKANNKISPVHLINFQQTTSIEKWKKLRDKDTKLPMLWIFPGERVLSYNLW
jgi:hypothetical protein